MTKSLLTLRKNPSTPITDQEAYEALKAWGHSPAMAATIVLDAKRGDEHSRKWIKQVRKYVGADAEERANG